MKHHIGFKFLAILLATLTLLVAIGSTVGIVYLVRYNMYQKSFDQVYEEEMAGTRRDFAVNLAHRYASLELGGLSEQYLLSYRGSEWLYDTFEPGKYCYTIRNAQGTIVESTLTGDTSGASRYEIIVTDIRYRHIAEGIQIPAVPTIPPIGSSLPQETPTEPGMTARLFQDGYYDQTTNSYVEFLYYYNTISAFTVELYLFPGALPESALWSLLHTVWELRFYLFAFLAIALLLFAGAIVYLCCAAGKTASGSRIRPGGLNRLPLDLYLAFCGAMEVLIIFLLPRLVDISIHRAPQIIVSVCALLGAAGCLVLIGFSYALVTQIKTGKGYWWRHSILGFLFRKFWRFCLKAHDGLNVLHSLLPLVWQWLLMASIVTILPILLFLLFFACRGWDLLAILFLMAFVCSLTADAAIVCYGAYCFGTLRRGIRQMAQGELDHKVPTDYRFSAFRDFGSQLNDLAGAAHLAAERQLKSERMKTDLITNVSHDIKTPLTSIINYVDLMQKPHSPEEGEAYLEVLSRQSLRLKKLVDDLMDMSKASSGNMPVDIIRLDAAETINQSLGEFGDKLSRAQLIPIFHSPEEPIYMMADGRLVWRVMSNLLGNTVKYALPGTRLYLDLARVDDWVTISVKNISREELNVSADELLERFVRGDTSRNAEGSGLGLNIALSLMELQHGKLQLLVDGDLFKATLFFPAADQHKNLRASEIT